MGQTEQRGVWIQKGGSQVVATIKSPNLRVLNAFLPLFYPHFGAPDLFWTPKLNMRQKACSNPSQDGSHPENTKHFGLLERF